jgi:4-hydroxy-tetrahydrodipicolinate reductase
MVEAIAASRGHTVVLTIDNDEDWKKIDGSVSGTVIDFSFPETAEANMVKSFNLDLPVVCGTTGWHDKLEEVKEKCTLKNGSAVVSSNFSVGVNILFALNRKLAALMNGLEQYTPMISETHHIYKKDAPSGTAITLGNEIVSEIERINNWSGQEIHDEDELFIQSFREGNITGIHEVLYSSEYDTLSLRHEAADRRGFAIGAVIAAEWLEGRKGFYSMQDVLGI